MRRTSPSRLPAFLLLFASVFPSAVLAQAKDPDAAAAAARAIQEWVADYDRGRIGPKGLLHSGAGLQPAYVASAERAGAIGPKDPDRLTHLEVLNKLLYVAESNPSAMQADALLGLAAAGLETSFLDPASLELRELGHGSLLRSDDQGMWFHVLRAAAGERVPLFGEVLAVDQGQSSLPIGPARRVAAIRLLAAKGLPVFRATLEASLVDPDPRVRLAAAEALEMQPRGEALARVLAALGRERHPVVAQAVVRLLRATLRAGGDGLDAAVRAEALATARTMFGRSGWRTDMDLLDLVEAYPDKDAIPMLIDALDLTIKSPDALVTAINKRASPLLRERASGLLRAMTGALVPGDDPVAWRQFWEREKERLVVPATLQRERTGGTRATFFGVPVTGSSIAFVIDTSGSMDEPPAGTLPSADRRGRANTRLRAAKEQLLSAVQAMPAESQYLVVTFAAKAHVWTPSPVRPSAGTHRSLTELLSRLRAHGGTNLFDGLSTALFTGDQRYGEQAGGKVDEVFVLSDGEPTAGEVRETAELLAIVREANKYAKVRINTVFTGTDAGGGIELLRRLAEENGGVFVQR